IQRCLAKDPNQRYESTRDLAQDLKAVLEDTALPVEQVPEIKSLAVLPLVNTSGYAGQEYFVDGMTEAVITALAKISCLKVISRTSAMRYKHTDKSLPQIARELNVQAIVEGSVLRAGNRVRITAQLIDAVNDRHLWAESYEGDLGDILSLQNQVARSIASEIQIKLTPNEQTLLERSNKINSNAQEAYLKGRFYLYKWSRDGMNKALEYFKAALESEPEFASAHAALSEAYISCAFWGWDSLKEVAPRARGAALKALELDPDLAEAHVALGNVKVYAEWDFSGGEKEYKRAIELNPNYAEVHAQCATLGLGLGRYDVVRQEIEQALKLDPHSAQFNLLVGISLFWQGHYKESIEQCRKVLQMDPDYHQAHFFLAMDYRHIGLDGDAFVEWKKLFSIEAGRALWFMDRAFRRSGLEGGLVAAARFLKWGYLIWKLLRYVPFTKGRYVPPVLIAILYASAREKDETFRWLERAYRERDVQILTLKAPLWDFIRSDPRFENVMSRTGIPK
ncbi:MAG TPA: tetratricopeptide repeat protein, partial [Pyrinomonadaceae bacterium]|nr:tetratricopeptide repeat protein [Pyrinomonadaceae bacterium]